MLNTLEVIESFNRQKQATAFAALIGCVVKVVKSELGRAHHIFKIRFFTFSTFFSNFFVKVGAGASTIPDKLSKNEAVALAKSAGVPFKRPYNSSKSL